MHDRPSRFLMIPLLMVLAAPTASAAGLDLFTPQGRTIPILGSEVHILTEGDPVASVEQAEDVGAQGEVWHVGPVPPGTRTQGEGAEVAPVAPIAEDAKDARAERNAADVARLMPWIGAIAGLTVLVLVCAAIGGAWSRRAQRKGVPKAA